MEKMKTGDADFIDIEFVSASSNFLCFYVSSPPHSTDFEFLKLPVSSHDSDSTPSPADELFYRGKLLPLHLPPRLQMVEKLQTPSEHHKMAFQGQRNDPFLALSSKPATANKPVLESNIITPSESRRVSASTDLSSDEVSFGWSTEMRSFMNDHSQKSRLWNLKQSSFGQKIKTSRAFLKSLFGKSGCTNDSSAKATHNNPHSNHVSHKKLMIRNGNCNVSAATLKQTGKQMTEDAVNSQMRSFSRAAAVNNMRRSFSGTSGSKKCLSSSSSGSTSSSWSSSSSRLYDIQLLTRSCSFNLEIENSIDGAISHCKRSQELSWAEKNLSKLRV